MKFTIAALLVLAVSQFCASAQVLPYGNPDEAGSGSWSSAYREAYALFRKGMYDRSMILFKDLAGDSADGNAYGYYVLSAVRLRAPGYENLIEDMLSRVQSSSLIAQIRFSYALNLLDVRVFEGASAQFAVLS